MKCSKWSSPQAHCGEQMAVTAIQCSAVSTLEEVALAVVDCMWQRTTSARKEYVNMHCLCRVWQPDRTADDVSKAFS